MSVECGMAYESETMEAVIHGKMKKIILLSDKDDAATIPRVQESETRPC